MTWLYYPKKKERSVINMQKLTDIEIIQRIQQGDENAFEELYRRYERKVYYTAFSMMRTEADAHDIVQATFLQVHTSIQNLRNPDYFLLWLNRITCHKCKDLFRKQNRVLNIDVEQEHVKNAYIDDHLDYNPEKHMKFESDKEVIHHFIQELPYLQREVIVLYYFQNLSIQEIAQVLQEPVGTIKSRLFLARKQLKKHIEVYEAKNQLPLNFHACDIEALLLSYFSSFLDTSVKGHPFSWRHMAGTAIGKSVLAVSVLIGSGSIFYLQQNKQMVEMPLALQQSMMEAVQYQDTVIENERHAYFTLLHWAANHEQIENRSSREAQAIRPVYEYLKKQKGPYWQYLLEKGWNTSYENSFSKIN